MTPLGNTVEATWSGLMAGRSGASPITKFDASDFPVRFACEVKDFDPLHHVEKKEARKMGSGRERELNERILSGDIGEGFAWSTRRQWAGGLVVNELLGLADPVAAKD